MRITNEKELEAVLRLDAKGRFEHFVKRVADEERAWGLWKDGWAMFATDEGGTAFPLWPAKEYADRCRTGDLASHVAEAIPLEDLLNELLPKLEARGVRPAVFPTPAGKGVLVSTSELAASLRQELENYE